MQSLNYLTKTKNELKQMFFHCLPLPCLAQSLHLFNLAQNYTKPKCQDALCNIVNKMTQVTMPPSSSSSSNLF